MGGVLWGAYQGQICVPEFSQGVGCLVKGDPSMGFDLHECGHLSALIEKLQYGENDVEMLLDLRLWGEIQSPPSLEGLEKSQGIHKDCESKLGGSLLKQEVQGSCL